MYKVVVKASAIHNKGLFAGEAIPKGAEIIEYTGEKITNAEAERREQINDRTGLTYIMILDKKYCIDGAVGGNDSTNANHSCDPSCYLSWHDGRVFIRAGKKLKKGDEITYDYEFDDTEDPADRTPCHCGSKKCRGYINIIDH
jgi:SET domain-containing protein